MENENVSKNEDFESKSEEKVNDPNIESKEEEEEEEEFSFPIKTLGEKEIISWVEIETWTKRLEQVKFYQKFPQLKLMNRFGALNIEIPS